MMKSLVSANRLFLLSLLITLTAACQSLSPQVTGTATPVMETRTRYTTAVKTIYAIATKTAASWTSTPRPTVTNTPLPIVLSTATSEPTIQPAQKLELVSGQASPVTATVSEGKSPNFLTPKSALPTQAGEYAIYGVYGGGISYISTDGSRQGDLLGNKNPMAGLQNFFVTSNLSSPSLVFFSEAPTSIYVWITDLTGKPLKSWRFQNKSSVYCGLPLFSPAGHWTVVFCSEGKVYLNLINLKTGENKTLATPCYGEFSPIPGGTAWAQANWSKNEDRFGFWCHSQNYYCFISTIDGEGQCKDVGEKIM